MRKTLILLLAAALSGCVGTPFERAQEACQSKGLMGNPDCVAFMTGVYEREAQQAAMQSQALLGFGLGTMALGQQGYGQPMVTCRNNGMFTNCW